MALTRDEFELAFFELIYGSEWLGMPRFSISIEQSGTVTADVEENQVFERFKKRLNKLLENGLKAAVNVDVDLDVGECKINSPRKRPRSDPAPATIALINGKKHAVVWRELTLFDFWFAWENVAFKLKPNCPSVKSEPEELKDQIEFPMTHKHVAMVGDEVLVFGENMRIEHEFKVSHSVEAEYLPFCAMNDTHAVLGFEHYMMLVSRKT